MRNVLNRMGISVLIISWVSISRVVIYPWLLAEAADVDVSSQWVKHVIGTGFNGAPMMHIGDLNNDGRTDVFGTVGRRHSYSSDDGIWWIEAPQDPKGGLWGQKKRVTSSSQLIRWSLATGAGDVDNDGDTDVASLSFNDGRVFLAINPQNNGGDVNSQWQTLIVGSGGGRYGERVAITDVDQDGYRDIIFPQGSGSAGVIVLFNPGGVPTDSWAKKFIGPITGSDAHDICSGDMDNDGDLDIVWAGGDGSSSGDVFWYEHPDGNARNGSWTRHRISSTSHNFGALQLDDINGDGSLDVIVSEAHGHPGKAYWYANPNSPSASSWSRYYIGKQTYPHASTLIDVDGDGIKEYWLPDCSAAATGDPFEWADGGIVYFKRCAADPTQPWTKHKVAGAPERGRNSGTVDVDGDGDLDVLATGEINGGIYANTAYSLVFWENKTPPAVP